MPWPTSGKTPASLGPVTSVIDSAWHWLDNADGREEIYHYRGDEREDQDYAGRPEARAAQRTLRAIAEHHGQLP